MSWISNVATVAKTVDEVRVTLDLADERKICQRLTLTASVATVGGVQREDFFQLLLLHAYRTMSTQSPSEPNRNTLGQPAWEIAQLFPMQGDWSEIEYIGLNTNHLVELNDGKLEVLIMPTEWHQLVVLWLYRQLLAYVEPSRLGMVLVAPIRVRVGEGKFREPDIVFMLTQNYHRRTNKYWNGADLVMEVVSEDDPDRDLVTKRQEYAQANIPEYWMVDPRDRTITVLTLDESSQVYRESGRFTQEKTAQSKLLDGFSVSVTETFAEKI